MSNASHLRPATEQDLPAILAIVNEVIANTLASLELWIGAVAGVAMIAGAVYYRRWREVAD